ncbi:hypothetical protein Y032_0762g2139 [Ancylostoma ceylanicum]|uniref:TIL domain-containing protein n=1 Tax=Ancylostoma ceylanicum TaxID=53326 RepID=A0A016WDB6_9BILA|nr:hypothetical protein Y032_0762g2139 [Ancylostoma ceylanicum]
MFSVVHPFTSNSSSIYTMNSALVLAIACSLIGFAREQDFKCPENEEFFGCFNGCEPTCKHPDIGCLAVCGAGGCTCKKGYLRNDNGKCVPRDKC